MKTNYTYKLGSKEIQISTSTIKMESPILRLSAVISRFASKVWSVYIGGAFVTPSTKSPSKVKVLVSSSLK